MLPLLHAASGPYQFRWGLHPDVLLLALFVEAAYLYTVTRLRPVLSDAGRVRRSQVVLFTAGVFSAWAVAGTPIHDLSEQYLLSFHMFQHTVLMLIAAPLMLAGIPAWIWQSLLRLPHTLRIARVIVHPVIAFSIANVVLLVTHLPTVMDYQLNQHWFHFFVHAAQLVAGMIMWWPILSNVPELPRISAPLQMAYLFLQSLLPAVLSAFITFAEGAVYPFYANAPRTWGISPVADQQIGGGVFKLVGSVILWSFITVIFFQWWNREQAAEKEPHWEDVRGELEMMGLTSDKR